MNYLAHIYLSCDNEDLLIGNFIADSISNKELSNYSPEVQAGVFLHRKIDAFTDLHPMVRLGTKRMRNFHGKYAPVVVDILYDHLLAHNWKHYSKESLPDFAASVYRIFQNRMEEMPLKLKRSLPRMIEHDWLNSYATFEGLAFTMRKMDERTRFPSNFSQAVGHLQADFQLFNDEFNTFFPEVIHHVQNHCDC